ncbi:hypothetical protein [Gordonia paraffinivorans]|uniref:DUF4115 domain-containing protein n=1 Tax=Gordonia paraffinivorans NBRC 108238 TaxID=1223543 RepID=A0ABQ0IN82_9ACTN|nr:hypothetical protein [Gordonia paraffinivorans]MBY4573270.1 hypothetical protein [Gordonia paraffinivorans]PWD42263.1 hypothetical protein ACN93_13985 [Gordonia paraffinivorans]GAC85016.1 hypothetical protein GP2_028_00720 [Gordonia paraffinivorans NBRC 108238]
MSYPYGGPNPDAEDTRRGGGDPYGPAPMGPRLYPPLGYAPDGTPLFRPFQPTNTELHAAEQAARAERVAAEEAAAREEQQPSRLGGLSTSTLIVCLGMVVLVAVAIVGFGGVWRDRTPDTTLADPPATLLETVPRTFEPPTLTPDGRGSVPGRPGQRVDPQNKSVSYEVTIDGQATILYVDAVGLRSDFAPSNPWSVEFTGSDNPLRVLVIAGTGSGARCVIRVDGEVVVEDAVSASSPRRTASCIA